MAAHLSGHPEEWTLNFLEFFRRENRRQGKRWANGERILHSGSSSPYSEALSGAREALGKHKFSELRSFKERTVMRNTWQMKKVDLY
jgi:hypothetical protein